MVMPPECQPLADELATLRAVLPSLRDAVAQARGVTEKLQARHELAVQERAVASRQVEFDECAGIPPPGPPVLVSLQGSTDILIDGRGDGSWLGVLLREALSTYTLTFVGSTVAITETPPPVNVGGGFVRRGPFGIATGADFNIATRSGGAFGTFDHTTGLLEVPLFIDFDEGERFPGIWNAFYGYQQRAQAAFLLSTETRLPLEIDWPSGLRVRSDGSVILAGIATYYGGRRDGRQLATVVIARFLGPLPTG